MNVAVLRPIAAAVVLAATLAAAMGAIATPAPRPPGEWTRISDAGVGTTDQVGLARSRDGVLHVAWVRRNAERDVDLVHATLDVDGRVTGAGTPIVRGWNRIYPAALVAGDDGVRAAFPGTRRGGDDPYAGSIYVARLSGDGWSLSPGGVVHSRSVSDPPGAALHGDDVWLAWGHNVARAHPGSGRPDESATRQMLDRCCSYNANVAVDGATGEVVMGWYSNAAGNRGVLMRTVSPDLGPIRYLPASANEARTSSRALDQRMAISGRRGSAGVHALYCQGYPFCTSLHLVRHPDGEPMLVARDRGPRAEGLAAGPDGRLWLWWERGNRVSVVRTNRAVTRFGEPTVVSGPPGVRNVMRTAAEGSAGPLDLLVTARTAEGTGVWHTQVLPRLEVRVSPATVRAGEGGAVRVTVTDVGDPVAGVEVSAGALRGTTGPDGVATLTVPRGAPAATLGIRATLARYQGGTGALTIRP